MAVETVQVDSFEFPWVANDHGDDSGFTLQRVGDTLYIDVYASKDDAAEGRMTTSIMTTVETLRDALNEV